MAKKQRLLQLLRILYEETDDAHGYTREELAEALRRNGVDAERKTIYDDIATLEAFGIDIEKRRGKETRYHIVSRKFELAELKLLVDAVQSSRFITKKKSDTLIRKLEGLASRHEGQCLQRQVYIDRIKTGNESIYYSVDAIHEAIGAGKKISFLYFQWTMKKEKHYRNDGNAYTVTPLALVWEDENYYLIAHNAERGKIRHYRVDKMEKIVILSEPKDSVPFDVTKYTQRTFGMYGGEERFVTLSCKEESAGIIIDRFGKELLFECTQNGRFLVRVHVNISPQFFSWIMGLGDLVEIVAPEDVRKEFLKQLKETLALYE